MNGSNSNFCCFRSFVVYRLSCSASFPIFGFFAVFTTFLSKLLSVFQQPFLWQVLPVVVFFIPCFYLLCIFECCHSPCLKVHFHSPHPVEPLSPFRCFALRKYQLPSCCAIQCSVFWSIEFSVLSFLCASSALLLFIAHFTVSVYSRTFFTLLVITKK